LKLEIKILKQLSGHSGCKIYLIEEGERIYIRKYSASTDYNERFLKQINKQSEFEYPNIKSPKIIKQYYKNGLLVCDMEFIRGYQFNEWYYLIPSKELDSAVDSLLMFISSNYRNSTYINKHNEIHEKIDSLNKTIYIPKKVLDFIKNVDYSNIPIGLCHGDLTFENIIIDNEKNIFLIDFLDSFIESPLIDIGKLFQETHLLWSFRNTNSKMNNIHRNIIFQDKLNDVLRENNIDKDLVKSFTISTILRILPYSNENRITNSIYKYLNKIIL
jgi:thiamine kinase-like enzyme